MNSGSGIVCRFLWCLGAVPYGQGPLRTLLRAILYCFIFVAVFSIALDWRFSLVAGIGLGLTFTYELGRRASAVEGVAAPQEPRGFFSLKRQQISLALLRGSFLAAGAPWAFSIDFGLLFGLLTVTAMLFAFGLGFSPSLEFELLSRPHLSRRRLLGAFISAILLALAAALASWIKPVSAKPLDFGLRYGLVVELIGVLLATLSGFIEWYTDNLPERRLALLGICLIICGVVIQSVQYWVSLLDVLAMKAPAEAARLGALDGCFPASVHEFRPRASHVW